MTTVAVLCWLAFMGWVGYRLSRRADW